MPVWVNSIISGLTLAVVTALAGYCKSAFTKQHSEFEALKESQRNQLKASIVRTCNEALMQSWIHATELETLLRRFESYQQLGGNSYVEALVKHVLQLPVRGEVPDR